MRAKGTSHTSLTVACIKRLLPIGLSLLGGREQELVLCAKRKLIRHEADSDIESYLHAALDRDGDVDHPPTMAKGAWKKLVSSQRKKAVMACFRMVPLYALPVHRAVNLFISSYTQEWLDYEESLGVKLIEDITNEEGVSAGSEADSGCVSGTATPAKSTSGYSLDSSFKSIEDSAASHALEFMDSVLDLSFPSETEDGGDGCAKPVLPAGPPTVSGSEGGAPTDSAAPDPLTQLLTALSRSAMEQAPDDPLYLAYARIMGKGPCVGNQLALAHSRLWDAVGGFIYVSAQMQDKLSRDPDQLDLLREFLNLQKELMIMLLSMLEGNVVNGPIARQMVDTLAESSAYVEMILKFFDIFLRMKAITTSDAFLAFDVNGDGWISHREFRNALEQQKTYTAEEIGYIIACVDTNADGKVDFKEFTERFYNPAEDIGFNFALLLTNLSEHVPFDPRLERLVEKARGVLDVFEPHLGRIEITGSNGRIERVYFEIRQQHIDQWEAPQIKESKRSFLHSVVGESGDKEKLECFVNFCEDTIFEMQHAQEINGDEADMSLSKTAAFNRFLEITHLAFIGRAFSTLFHYISPSYIASGWSTLRQMSCSDIVLAFLGLQIGILICLTRCAMFGVRLVGQIIVAMASDPGAQTGAPKSRAMRAIVPVSPGGSLHLPPSQEHQWWLLSEDQQLLLERVDPNELAAMEEEYDRARSAAAVSAALGRSSSGTGSMSEGGNASMRTNAGIHTANLVSGPTAHQAVLEPIKLVQVPKKAAEPKQAEEDKTPQFNTRAYMISLFASNFYRFKISALILAFLINFLLLFFKVHQAHSNEEGLDDVSEGALATAALRAAVGDAAEGAEDAEPEEWITLADSNAYIAPLIAILAAIHSLLSFSMLIAYYYLKVPLVIFKREKEISRMLEFEGMWISQQPAEDNLRAHWDKLVLSTPSFPQMYWGKFVKKKVRNKYSVQYDYDEITTLLGMDKPVPEPNGTGGGSIFSFGVDIQYLTWKWGVVFTDISFLYLAVYFAASFFGNFNYFLYACHLLDVAVSFKTLRTIIQSVTHNGKQLVLTVMLTSIVIYLYTVIAFNFLRKFYCFIFHLHTGLRAGGGIGDEIEAPDGDEWEGFRIMFDLTFFFFVIVILLAIIQGLIIDAFGDLRDQLEQVKEDLESKCFICGIGKEYFDKIPHGFEQHVEKEHNFANYMYFLMHIINKPDTEYTGQESYVWELYQQRCWDFFPIGDCFRKQYEEELQPK
ncbi:EF hand, partial [Opisthorchis viverrini]